MPSTEPWAWSATTIVKSILERKISVLEVLDCHLARIEETNPAINAVVTLTAEIARAQALSIDKRISKGEQVGPLVGVPIGVKDVTATAGIRTTYGSPLFADHIPDKDDIIVQRIKEADGVIIGKTNTPEFATGGNTYNDVFGATRNPWNTELSAGGSTGGGGAGLISGMFPIASGSDLGGSLRIPAAFCGVMGLRPTPGLVPAGPGNTPFDTLGVPGPMARSSVDLALLLEVMAQPHLSHPHSPQSRYMNPGKQEIENLKIAYIADVADIGVDESIAECCRNAATAITDDGHIMDDCNLNLSDGRRAFSVLRGQWMVNKYLHLIDRLDELGTNLASNIRKGLDQKPTEIAEAETIRSILWFKLVEIFEKYDAVLTPTLPIPPFPVDQNYPEKINGKKMESYFDWFAPTLIFSLFGLPALSVPSGLTDEGLPAGLQIVGPRFSEALLMKLADIVSKKIQIRLPVLS
ncbi:MAG TPA: amidase [Rhodospirillales bacterium]|nr:amidase [Rhodospirillales bacterium]HIN75185.1 amidase [Rhodospirillales bacterium]